MIDSQEKKLTLIDFEHWESEKNPQERALRLLLGTMEIAGWLLRDSKIYTLDSTIEQQDQFLADTCFPSEYFSKFKDITKPLLVNSVYPDDKLVKAIRQQLQNKTDQELITYLSGYIDLVINRFKETAFPLVQETTLS